MFEKYSNSRDSLYSFIFVIVILIIGKFIDFNFLNFNTEIISNSLLQLFGVFFVFILTIITIMFMFDYKKSPILRKLESDNLFNQIFKRFFDTLVVVSLSLIYFLFLSVYFESLKSLIFNFSKFEIGIYQITNFIVLNVLTLSCVRLIRCFNLLNLLHKSIIYKYQD